MYYSDWTESDQKTLIENMSSLPSGYAFSIWADSFNNKNPLIDQMSSDHVIRYYNHFYHVGPLEENRMEIKEALILSKKSASKINTTLSPRVFQEKTLNEF